MTALGPNLKGKRFSIIAGLRTFRNVKLYLGKSNNNGYLWLFKISDPKNFCPMYSFSSRDDFALSQVLNFNFGRQSKSNSKSNGIFKFNGENNKICFSTRFDFPNLRVGKFELVLLSFFSLTFPYCIFLQLPFLPDVRYQWPLQPFM